MRAMLGVKASLREPQPFHRSAMNKVLRHDFLYIFDLHETIPDSLGIDHDDRTVLALVEAARLVRTNQVLEPSVFNSVLESRFDLLTAFGKTAWTGSVFIAFVGAYKEMTLKFWHWRVPSLPLCNGEVRPA
jgi:hypothetical protein